MKLISWNVNGIRAVYKKGFLEFVERENPDILCLQETKAHPDQVEPPLRRPAGMHGYWASAQRKGYSGVATFCREEPLEARCSIGEALYDTEGRIVWTQHPHFQLYNIYFPNGGMGPERHQFKQAFLAWLYEHLSPKVAAGEKIVLTGDYNIAHREVDIYDPKGLATASGFLPEERAWMDRFMSLGFVDTYRHFYPQGKDKYTWWSYRERGRLGNRGWRIDYFSVTANLLAHLKGAQIWDHIESSDHCPVVLEMDFS